MVFGNHAYNISLTPMLKSPQSATVSKVNVTYKASSWPT